MPLQPFTVNATEMAFDKGRFLQDDVVCTSVKFAGVTGNNDIEVTCRGIHLGKQAKFQLRSATQTIDITMDLVTRRIEASENLIAPANTVWLLFDAVYEVPNAEPVQAV